MQLARRCVLPGLLVAALLPGLTSSSCASPADVEAEIRYFAEWIRGDSPMKQPEIRERLAWSGIQDERVYGPIRDEIINHYQDPDAAAISSRLSWLVEVLALSGMDTYRADLRQVAAGASTAGLRDRARGALLCLDLQAERNAVLSAGLVEAPPGQLQQCRLQNMLGSNDAELIRWAAKVVHRDYWQDAELLAAVNQSLLRNYPLGMRSGYHLDALHWMLKTLARGGDSRYRPTLDEVAAKSSHRGTARIARQCARRL